VTTLQADLLTYRRATGRTVSISWEKLSGKWPKVSTRRYLSELGELSLELALVTLDDRNFA
jgi:hypothetical protein